MPAVFTRVRSSGIFEDERRKDPLAVRLGWSTALGSINTIFDSDLVGSGSNFINLNVVRLINVRDYEVRAISGFTPANGRLDVAPNFSTVPQIGEPYAIVTPPVPFGDLPALLATYLQPTQAGYSTGIVDWTVQTTINTISGVHRIKAWYIDVSGFTVNAVLTFTYRIRTGPGELLRQFQRRFRVDGSNNLYVAYDNKMASFNTPVTQTISLDLQSDNPLDNAVNVDYTIVIGPVI